MRAFCNTPLCFSHFDPSPHHRRVCRDGRPRPPALCHIHISDPLTETGMPPAAHFLRAKKVGKEALGGRFRFLPPRPLIETAKRSCGPFWITPKRTRCLRRHNPRFLLLKNIGRVTRAEMICTSVAPFKLPSPVIARPPRDRGVRLLRLLSPRLYTALSATL